MALFTDSDALTSSDLTAIDSEVELVARTQNPPIDLTTTIRGAFETCGDELKNKFQNFSGYLLSPGMNVAHVAAVMNIGSSSINRPRFSLSQVAITEPDPNKRQMRRWMAFEALYQLYRASFQRFVGKNSDRFSEKMDLYASERDKAWESIASQGVPIVLIPLPCPGAIRSFESGEWTPANISHEGSGSSETGQTYDVAITWVGAAYASASARNNAESAPSTKIAVMVAAGEVITISISSLTPPSATPPIGTTESIYTQMPAVGWNIYVGLTGQALYLQNSSPLSLGTTSRVLAGVPILSGGRCGVGQFSDYSFAFTGGMIWRA